VSPTRSTGAAWGGEIAGDLAPLHHPVDPGEDRDVGERIPRNRDEVGPGPGFDDPRLPRPTEELGGGGGRAPDRLDRRHAELHLPLEFLRLVDLGPREAAGVGPEDDLDAGLPGVAERPGVRLRQLAADRAAGGGARAGDVVRHGERGAERDAFARHFGGELGPDRIAVLDRIDASRDGQARARVGARVGRDLQSLRVRLGDGRFDLLLRPVRRRVHVSVLRQSQPPRVGVDLQPVGPVRRLLAHRPAAAIGAVAGHDAGRKFPVGAEVGDRVAAGRREGGTDDLHPRSRDHAFVHRVPERHVVVARTLRLEVANRREAVLEGDPECPHGARDAMGRILLEDLVLVLGLGGVPLEEDVRVDVDQAGQNRPGAEIDHLRARRDGRAHALDPARADDDDRVRAVSPGANVEQPGGAHGDGCRLLSRRGQGGEPRGEAPEGELLHRGSPRADSMRAAPRRGRREPG
jgi:hypothetical protein